MAAVHEPGRRVGVEEGAVGAGARDLEGVRARAASIREARARGHAVRAARVAAARLAGVPLDLAVVELDVEVARSDVRTIDQEHLEVVQNGRDLAVTTDPRPVDAERGVTVDGSGSEGDRVADARVHVGEEGRDDRDGGGVQRNGRVFGEGLPEGEVAVVVQVQRPIGVPVEVDRERQVQRRRRAPGRNAGAGTGARIAAVVVRPEGRRIEAGNDRARGRRVSRRRGGARRQRRRERDERPHCRRHPDQQPSSRPWVCSPAQHLQPSLRRPAEEPQPPAPETGDDLPASDCSLSSTRDGVCATSPG